jgi:NADPH:quinone reductase-like Zn-dependent oxidoreductase
VLGGLHVIGSVGDDTKVAFLTKELGFASAFNYKKEGYAEALKRLAPEGIDIYYDNVGGEALDEALSALKPQGRIGKLDVDNRVLIPETYFAQQSPVAQSRNITTNKVKFTGSKILRW